MRERNISMKSSPVRLFEIRANYIHQLVRRFSWVFPIVGFEYVVSQMPFDQLCHQSIHGAPSGGDQLQDFGAVGLVAQSAFHRVHLSANSLHADDQFVFVFRGMPHGLYYTPVGIGVHLNSRSGLIVADLVQKFIDK
jgi:hypothetical protein